MSDTDLFFSRTGMDPDSVQRTVDQALRNADDGELFLEYSQSESFAFDDGRLKAATFDTSQGFGQRAVAGEATGYAIILNEPPEDYLERLRAASAKRFKNWRRLDSKLEREVGPVRMEASTDPAVYQTIMDWKREQLVRTGVADFLRPDWTRALLANLAAGQGALRGLNLTLWAGDTLVAGHFGVTRNGWYHPWVASTNPDLGEYSPGQTFLMKAIAAMPGLGLTVYDLGPSHDHYKRHYAAPAQVVGEGTAAAATPAGMLAGGRERVWTMAGARRDGLVGSLRRRLDAIAVTELSTAGRVRGFVDAVAAQPRRRLAMEGE